MKIYKLNIDTTQPIRQALKVPVGETKYGIAVNVLKGDHTIRNLSCTIDVSGQTFEPTKKLDDGSFLFELDSMDGEYVAKVHAAASPTVIEGGTYTNNKPSAVNRAIAVAELSAGVYYQDEFNPFDYKNQPVRTSGYLYNLYTNPSSDVNFTSMVYKTNDPTKTIYFKNSENKIIPPDTNLVVAPDASVSVIYNFPVPGHKSVSWSASYVGYNVDCYVDVTLKSSKDSQPDMITDDPVDFTDVDATNLSADNFTLSGVTYVPTTLSVDGVEYKVLAAVQPEPEG